MAGPTDTPTLAAFVGGMLALHAWTRLRERRQHEMARRSAAAAAPRARKATRTSPRARRARVRRGARGDTALVIIDLQNDYVDADGPVLRHYSAAEAGRGAPRSSARAGCCAPRACGGLTVAHSRAVPQRHEREPRARRRPGRPRLPDRAGGRARRRRDRRRQVDLRSVRVDRPRARAARARRRARAPLRLPDQRVRRVAATAREAVDRYFRVCVVDDACGAVDARLHDAALEA